MNKFSAAAGLALALATGSAFAADIPTYKAPPPPPPPVFSWTGVYGGVNIGYGFSSGYQQWGSGTAGVTALGFQLTTASPAWTQPTNLNGVVGGGQAGVNFQFNRLLVLGVEADIQASGLQSRSTGLAGIPLPAVLLPGGFPLLGGPGTLNGISNTTTSNVDWYGSFRARFGLTPFSPNLMLYGTAGLAYGGVNTVSSHTSLQAFGFPAFLVGGGVPYRLVANGNGASDKVQFGWTAGAGAEWAPMSFPNWSVKVEYLYTDLGSTTINSVGFGPVIVGGVVVPTVFGVGIASFNQSSTTVRTAWHTVRAGINYRVPMGGAAPIMAAY
jgi:outer membrane immunogenic protein